MKLFSKLKDYHNLLEEILDKKTFSSVSKSLLYSMFYKLEISYKDYEQVKVDALSLNQFFYNTLDVIKKYCDNIKTVEPESIQAELLKKHNVCAVTNEKERSILTYPTEEAMLYAISDIEPKYFYIKSNFVFKTIMQKTLVAGYKQNTIEILKNFNGWSWDINVDEKNINCIFNLIYQNIMMIKGEQFLTSWRKDNLAKKDYLQDMKRSIKLVTGNDSFYWSLCKLLYLLSKGNQRKLINQQIEDKKNEYEKKHNNTEQKKLKNYDEIINNTKTVYEELLEMQKYFLVYLQKKIVKSDTREQIVELIYRLRYYENIPFSKGICVKQYKKLKEELDKTWKQLITKACKMGILKIINMDINTNFEIIKYILDTKIIDLEEIKIYVELQEEKILVKVYDNQVFEKQKEIEFNGDKKDIIIRKKRNLNLFN